MGINYDRLFNVRVRNPKTKFHDVCKIILVSLLKEKHPNTLIYTEYNPDNPNSSYPDIWMKIKNRRYVFEIQKDLNKKWLKDIQEKYDLPNYDLIIVPTNDLPSDVWDLIEELRKFVI